jgi:hypothetical protein
LASSEKAEKLTEITIKAAALNNFFISYLLGRINILPCYYTIISDAMNKN